MHLNDKFKKGMLYDIDMTKTSDNPTNLSVNIGNDTSQLTDSSRYSIYGIKLTDSCLNAIMDFLKAKTNDPTHCLSELEIIQMNNIPSNAKISFNVHNLRDKQKNFNLRFMDDNTNNISTNTNEIISQQDVVMGVRFSNDSKKLISVGNINYKLAVMGNNEAFDMTKKKIENQAQKREQSKAKYIKSSTATTTTTKIAAATTTRNILMNRLNSNPVSRLNGVISHHHHNKNNLNIIKNAAKNIPVKSISPKSTPPLSKMIIRNISTSSKDITLKNSSDNSIIDTNEYSLKDHVIFNLLISPMSLDDLSERVSKDTKKSITKTTIYHLIKTLTTCEDESSRKYSLLTNSHKTLTEIKKWPFYNEHERECAIKNITQTNNNSIKNTIVNNVQKRKNPHSTTTTSSNHIDNKRIINQSGDEQINKHSKLDSTLYDKNLDNLSNFKSQFPPIQHIDQLNNYIHIYEQEYPPYLEKKIKLDNITAKIKSVRENLRINPNDQTQSKLLTAENKKLENDTQFQNLYKQTKYLHYKLAHIKSMIKKYQDPSV